MACKIEFLDAFGGVAIAAPDHHFLVVVLVLVAHAADVKRDLRFQAVEGCLHIVIHLDMDHGLHLEGVPALLLPALARALEALFDPAGILVHCAGRETERQPAIADIAAEPNGLLVARAEIDRDVGIHVQDRLQRLADAQCPVTGIGQLDLLAVMGHRLFPAEDLAHDLHIVLQPVVGAAPGAAIPALHDLWSGDTQTGDEATAACHGVDGCRAHGRVRRRAGGDLHDGGAKLDPLRLRGKKGEGGHGVRAIGFRRPHRVVAELLRPLHTLHRQVHPVAGIADHQSKFHCRSSPEFDFFSTIPTRCGQPIRMPPEIVIVCPVMPSDSLLPR